MHYFRLLAFFLLSPLFLFAQGRREYSQQDKKAIALYEEAVALYHYESYSQAFNTLEKVKKRNPKFIEAYLLAAQIYENLQQFEEAYLENLRALTLDSTFYPKAQLDAARLAYYTQQYAEGEELAQRYLAKIAPTDRTYHSAELIRASCSFSQQALQHPVAINPVALPSTVNTRYDEYFPSISADELTLSVTRLLPTTERGSRHTMQEDLYLSHRANKEEDWRTAQDIGAPVSSVYNEGSQSISSDGHRMYYSYCDGPCKIYYSDQDENGKWCEPKALPPIINMYKVSTKQPSISPDGRTLYFTSNRPGGYGGYDLWQATLGDNAQWQNVTNLGSTINTPWDEQSPFIHFDNQTLYFSSNGHPGLGDLDLYTSQRIADTVWTTPHNLGYPINTPATDMGLVISASGQNAYYASSRNQAGGMDIYTFLLPDSLQPTPVSYLKGTVQDATTGAPLIAHYQLIDLSTSKVCMQGESDALGHFLVCLPMGRRFALFASRDGYFDHSLHFDFLELHTLAEPFEQTIGLMPIRTGVTLTLRNVFFDTDSDALKTESFLEIDRWYKVLSDRPGMRIQIEGHTDNQGEASYNQKLSEKRARSVANYLISKGIAPNRIHCKGLGATLPAQTNDTPEGRAANRRTTCKILAL